MASGREGEKGNIYSGLGLDPGPGHSLVPEP